MPRLWKWLTIIWVAYPIILIVNLAVLFFITLSFYHNIIGAKDYKSIYDWDYPASAVGDFDNDGKEDEMTSGGCANFDSKTTFRKPLMCSPYYSPENQAVSGKEAKYPHHSYMIKEDGKWFILVMDRDLNLSKYAIESDSQISKVSPSSRDFINEFIYIVPVFVMDYLLYPVYLTAPYLGRFVLVLYVVVLGLFVLGWLRTKKVKGKPKHSNK